MESINSAVIVKSTLNSPVGNNSTFTSNYISISRPGRGDFDDVQIEADFFSGRLPSVTLSRPTRGQKRPAILQNPGMDTFCPTEPLCPRKDTLILLWPSKLVKMSFFGKINLQFQAFLQTPNLRQL